MKEISIVGMGKLGVCLAAAFTSRGVKVIGVDRDPDIVRGILDGTPHFYEASLEFILPLMATTNLSQAVQNTDATIVLVNTPSETDGSFSLRDVLPAVEQIGTALRDKPAGGHLVVISSTVMPGACGGEIREALEKSSGLPVGYGVELAYVPEFVALGNVLMGFLAPDFLIIGSDEKHTLARTEELYRILVGGKPVVLRMSCINAELAKIALNCFLTTKIAYVNQLSEICEGIPGASAQVVCMAIGMDKRISHHYLKPGPPYGGPCFPRDDRAIMAIADRIGASAQVAQSVSKFNTYSMQQLASRVMREMMRIDWVGGTIGILGLAFKEGTDCIIDSPGMLLLTGVEGCTVIGYDPLVKTECSTETAQELVDLANVVVVTTQHRRWKHLYFRHGQTVIDCWRMLNSVKIREAGAKYIGLGWGGPKDA